jgi:hypothetical protein
MFRSSRFSAVLAQNGGPIWSKLAVCRETLHGRLKEGLKPSENDRVLEVGQSLRSPDYFNHRGPKWAELGHHEEVVLGLAEVGLIAFLIQLCHTNMKIVGLGVLLVLGYCHSTCIIIYTKFST